jgi:hypothetical protein
MIPLNTKTGAHHRCKAKPFNRETRRQWWWYQQKKAEQQRQRNKQDHSYRLLSLSKHSEYAKTLGVAINATARKLKKHIIFKISLIASNSKHKRLKEIVSIYQLLWMRRLLQIIPILFLPPILPS